MPVYKSVFEKSRPRPHLPCTRAPHQLPSARKPLCLFLPAMQAPASSTSAAAAAAERPQDFYVVRPASVLAERLRAVELQEDELN